MACSCPNPVEFEASAGARTCARCAEPITGVPADLRDTASRADHGQAAPPVVWGMPFACPDCRAWGYIGVCVEEGRRSTDEYVTTTIGRKHRAMSSGCLRAPERMLLGRLRRREKPTTENPEGKLIFMLGKGEDEHTEIDVRWPLFDRRLMGGWIKN